MNNEARTLMAIAPTFTAALLLTGSTSAGLPELERAARAPSTLQPYPRLRSPARNPRGGH